MFLKELALKREIKYLKEFLLPSLTQQKPKLKRVEPTRYIYALQSSTSFWGDEIILSKRFTLYQGFREI